jgi:hypothetical protein
MHVPVGNRRNAASLARLTIAVLSATCLACDDEARTTSPTPTVTLTGTFAGTISDASGPGRMRWQLSQTGNQVTGTFTANDDVSGVAANGNISGTLSGATLTFRMTVPAGALPPPFATCSITSDGNGQVTTTLIDATYNGRNSCTGLFGNGRLSLTKQ